MSHRDHDRWVRLPGRCDLTGLADRKDLGVRRLQTDVMEPGSKSLEQTPTMVQPDNQAVPSGNGAEIDVPVVIEICGYDIERNVRELQNLRQRRTGNRDDDARAWRLGHHHLIEYAVTIEICDDRGVDRRRAQAECRDDDRPYHTERSRLAGPAH